MTLQLGVPLGSAGLNYEPVQVADFNTHARHTAIIIAEVLKTIECFSATIYQELGRYMRTIRGFELLPSREGVVCSFSDPTLPGIMNLNVCYSENGEPCLPPFWFTWFGHELGHTKHYLIDIIAYERGWTFATNPCERTPEIGRYGRALSVRTLMQIPYVHLYEWSLLMDFCVAGLDRVPWEVREEPIAFGDELADEIAESLELIHQCAELTPAGKSLLSRTAELAQRAARRWNAVRSHPSRQGE
jgi:hypothetical protein